MSYNLNMYKLGAKGSAIRELFEYGKKRKAEIGDENVFDFSLGNPSIPAPSVVNDTLIDLLKNKDAVSLHGYTSAIGDSDVRKSIKEYINKTYNANVDENFIYLTCGAAASLTVTLNALINKGDNIITFAPFFPEYKVFIEKANGIINIVDAAPDFEINFEDLKNKINENTKALIINSPNNPTGAVLKEKTIIKFTTFLKEKEKEYNHPIYLISDEPYREIIFDNIKYPFITNYYDDSIICYSFSKSLSLPGERIGYIIVNKTMEDSIGVYKAICGSGRSLGFVCAPALFQYMIPMCLGKTSDMNKYLENRDILYNSLKDIGYEIVYPDGAFYMFVKALESDANKFSEKAKAHEILIVPSDSFGIEGYVRISYCVDKEMIKRSIKAFKELYKEYYND